MTQKTFTVVNILIILLLFVVTDPILKFLHNGLFSVYEPYLEPIFLLSIASLVSSIIILIRKNRFQNWFNKFFIWYFPLAILITFMSPTSGYTMIHRFDMAVLLGVIMAAVTLSTVIYAVYQGWRKTKNNV